MRADSHLSHAPTLLRGYGWTRFRARSCDAGRCFVIAGGLGWPRLWDYTTRAAMDAFDESVSQRSGPRGAEKLRNGVTAARDALVDAVGRLVEREHPDATLLGLHLDAGELHVHCVGNGRAYMIRKGEAHRLTRREERVGGLLEWNATEASTLLDPGDVVLAGSQTAFSTKAIGKVSSVLDKNPKTKVAVLASLLTEPAEKAGAGAAAIAIRVR